MLMDYKKITTSTLIMAIGYFFVIISLFFNLYKVGLTYASFLAFAALPGYVLLTIGIGLVKKQSKLFKASFIIFILINIIFTIYLSFGISMIYVKFSEETIDNMNIALQIVQAFLDALIAIASCLYSDGLKNAFIRLNNKRMKTYSWIMSFSISKLIIISVALPTVKITKISAVAITTLSIIFDFIIQISLLVYMIISYCQLKHR